MYPFPLRSVREPSSPGVYLRQCLLGRYRRSIALPKPRDAIGIKDGVHAHERKVFHHRLSDQHPVEGISMMKWQACQSRNVLECNVQEGDIVRAHFGWNQDFEW